MNSLSKDCANRILSIFAVTVNLAAWSGSVSAAPSTNDIQSCRRFVQSFYHWYTAPGSKEDQLGITLKTRPNDFSPSLLRMLKEDAAAQAKVTGELVGLDFDPVLATNDTPYETYAVGKVYAKGGTYWGEIYGIHDKKQSDKPVLQPEMAFRNGHWQFVNFHYQPGKYPVNENLISILEVLKKDREKSAH